MPLECGVCLGRYSEACQLPCGHSFCGACLCTILSGPAAARLCPACRRPALQPNFALADAVREEEALRGQLYEAKVELSRSQAEVEGLGVRLDLSQKELARAKQESSELRSRLSEGAVQKLQGKLRESQELGAELERRLEAVSGDNGRLRTRLEERGAAAERAEALLADSEELCRSLVQRLKAKEAEAEEEKAKAAACEAPLGALRSVLLGGQVPASTDKASQELKPQGYKVTKPPTSLDTSRDSDGPGDCGRAKGAAKAKTHVACHNCDQDGHFKRDCPKKSKGGNHCARCYQIGHVKNDCPHTLNQLDVLRREHRCGLCRKIGHWDHECAGMLCHQCGAPGHRSANCPAQPCKFCHLDGHVAKDCPEGLRRTQALNRP